MTSSLIWHYLTARHTLGYGIHSPYLFEIANSILPDKNAYYCFSQIEKQHVRCSRAKKEKVSAGRELTPHINQILYKLARFAHAKRFVEVGTCCGCTTDYLSATSLESNVLVYDNQVITEAWDMAVLHDGISSGDLDDSLNVLLPLAHEQSVMVVDGIRRSAERWACWQALCLDNRVTATMDLGRLGLVFFNPHLQKKTYRLRI